MSGPVRKQNTTTTGESAQNYALTPDIPVVAVGDSITLGTGASTPAKSYVGLIAAATGASIINKAVGGVSLNLTVASQVYATLATESGRYLMMPGFNDVQLFGDDSNALLNYGNALRAAMVWLGTPNDQIIMATDTNKVTKSGTWAEFVGGYPSSSVEGQGSGVQNSTLTTIVYGSAIYIGYGVINSEWATISPGHPGQFTVTVDGTLKATVDTTANVPTVRPHAEHWVSSMRIGNLTPGPHTVVLTNTSTNGDWIWIDWFAGNNDPKRTGPYVYCGNTLRMNATGYATLAPAKSNVVTSLYNTVNRDIVAELAGDGLNIAAVNASRYYNPDVADVDTDNIHPNDTGHSHVAQAFLTEISVQKQPQDKYLDHKVYAAVGKLVAAGTQIGCTVTYTDAPTPTTQAWAAALDTPQVGSQNYAIRQLHPSGSFAATGNQVRVTITAGSAGPSHLSHVCFAQQGIGAAAVGTFGSETFKEFLFGGVAGVTVPTSTSVTSDWLDFVTLPSTNYMTIEAWASSNANYKYVATGSDGLYYKADSAGDYNVAAPAGYTLLANYAWAIAKIEVRTWPGFPRLNISVP